MKRRKQAGYFMRDRSPTMRNKSHVTSGQTATRSNLRRIAVDHPLVEQR
jgi:hypothetical protein